MREVILSQDKHSRRREPRQARAVHKVNLILEAAMRLLDEGDISALTTNAVAEFAGVSIGTLYQYFDDKQAILDALAQRELGGIADRTMRSLTVEEPVTPGERIRLVVRAVLESYGGRSRVHRLLMEYRLERRSTGGLDALYAEVMRLMASNGVVGVDGQQQPVSPADAFVLTHAIAGVLRAYVAGGEGALPQQQLEDALVRLAVRFVGLEKEAPPVLSKIQGAETGPQKRTRTARATRRVPPSA